MPKKNFFFYENKEPVAKELIPYKRGRAWYIKNAENQEIRIFTADALSQRRLKYENGEDVENNAEIIKKHGKTYVKKSNGEEVQVFTANALSQRRLKYESGEEVGNDAEIIKKDGKIYVKKSNGEEVQVFTATTLTNRRLKYENGEEVGNDAEIIKKGRKTYVKKSNGEEVQVFTTIALTSRRLKYENGEDVENNAEIIKKDGKTYVKKSNGKEVQVFSAQVLINRRLKYENGDAVENNAEIIKKGRKTYVKKSNGEEIQVFNARALRQHRFKSASEGFSLEDNDEAGISAKYLVDKIPPLPKPMYASEIDEDVLTRFPSRLSLIKLHERMQVEPTFSIASIPIHLAADRLSIQLQLHTYSSEIHSDDKLLFIFAGRKTRAYVPREVEAGLRVILVGTADDFAEIEAYCAPGIDFLQINELVSPTHGCYEPLGMVNSRRIAAFCCAMYFEREKGITHALMMDDNIHSVHGHAGIDSFSDLFSHMTLALKEKQALSVSIASVSNKGIRENNPHELGSKFYLFDLSALRIALGKNNTHLFLPFFPQPANHMWGEDYYFQLMFKQLGASFKRHGNVILDSQHYGLRRASLTSLFKRVATTADAFCRLSLDDLFGERLTAFQAQHFAMISSVSGSLKRIIENNISLHTQLLNKSRNTDLMIAHAWANKLSYKEPLPIAPIEEHAFLSTLSQQLGNIKDLGHLHVYQKKILERIENTIANQSRFIGHLTMATGTGKTYVQIYLAMAALLTGTTRPVVIVTPYQQLVQQAYEDFITLLQELGEEAPISISQVLKVDSEEASISAETLIKNRTLDGRPCILICCEESYRIIQEAEVGAADNEMRDEEPHRILYSYQMPCMILIDESHVQSHVVANLYKNEGTRQHCAIIGLSATPQKKQRLWQMDETLTLEYSRSEAVSHDYLAPCIIDRFDCPYSVDAVRNAINTMPRFLTQTTSPMGEPLSQKKVIIYVPNTDNKNQINYSRSLKETLDQANIPSYEINAEEAHAKEHLATYKKFTADNSDTKILICKGMAKIGFSDPEVDVVIYLQPGNAAEFAQSAGRAMRLSNRPKVAYVIGFIDVAIDLVFEPGTTADEKALARSTPFYREARLLSRGILAMNEEALPQALGPMLIDNTDTEDNLGLGERTAIVPAPRTTIIHSFFHPRLQGEKQPKRHYINSEDNYYHKIDKLHEKVNAIETSYGGPFKGYEELKQLLADLNNIEDVNLKNRLLSTLHNRVTRPLSNIFPKALVFISDNMHIESEDVRPQEKRRARGTS